MISKALNERKGAPSFPPVYILNNKLLLNTKKDLLHLLPHPTYSPNLAPSNYHHFRLLCNYLSGVSFNKNVQTKTFPDEFFESKPNASAVDRKRLRGINS